MSEDIDPHILKRYEIVRRIGKGAYGVVWILVLFIGMEGSWQTLKKYACRSKKNIWCVLECNRCLTYF